MGKWKYILLIMIGIVLIISSAFIGGTAEEVYQSSLTSPESISWEQFGLCLTMLVIAIGGFFIIGGVFGIFWGEE
jgi:hypothetical protein